MWKKFAVGIAIVIAVLILAFQLYILVTDLYGQVPASVKGEEDVVVRQGDSNGNRLVFACNVDWGEEVIPEYLEIFQEKEVHITFFVTGRWAREHPELLRKMYVAGHEIQNHGYGHKLCSGISVEQIKEEIGNTEDAIEEFLGIKTTVFAPPSGDYDSKTVDVCREMGYTISLWSSDTIDWRKDSNSSVIRSRVLSKPLNGAIVLMHPKPETAKALPGLIDEIRGKGISIVPLNRLFE